MRISLLPLKNSMTNLSLEKFTDVHSCLMKMIEDEHQSALADLVINTSIVMVLISTKNWLEICNDTFLPTKHTTLGSTLLLLAHSGRQVDE